MPNIRSCNGYSVSQSFVADSHTNVNNCAYAKQSGDMDMLLVQAHVETSTKKVLEIRGHLELNFPLTIVGSHVHPTGWATVLVAGTWTWGSVQLL
ncbi:hypothetical protein AVEN_256105-1 [Araneus ventricosus]|uniref:Uncharacterized protein n=1 Tax=Araneus ventricosus TaxID=182803 RepID=A0A4Y2D5Q4_ARAVE|nr:hypothetical protein AVEN_256105-1 [Araneus ventricosus]